MSRSRDISPEAGPGLGTPAAIAPWRAELRATLNLALPLALTQLAQIAIQTTDVVMMGWLGPRHLAAGTLGINLYHPLYLCGLGILVAVAPIAAQALGALRRRAVRRTVRQGFWAALAISLPACLVLWFGREFLLLIGQDPSVTLMTEDYLRAVLWALPAAYGIVVLRGFMTAHSRPRPVLVVTLGGILLNALGNYGLMFGNFGLPRLELIGAGISTTLVNLAMFGILISFVLRDRQFRRYAVLARFLRPDWPRFAEIFRIGLPISGTILAEAGVFAAAAFLMGWIGTEELAAHAIALQCAAVAFMVPLGVAQAATVRVGLAAGRDDRAGLARAGWVASALGFVFMSATALFFWFGGDLLVALFLPERGQERVAALGVAYLAIAALFQLFDGAQVIAAGALRGLKDTRGPMLIALFSYWAVGFPVSLLLGFPLGLAGEGIWLGLAAGLAIAAVLLVRRFAGHARTPLPARVAAAP